MKKIINSCLLALLLCSISAMAHAGKTVVVPGSSAAYLFLPLGKTTVSAVDTTPPTITLTNPTDITDTTAKFTASLDEAGKGYYIVQTKVTAAPSVTQVKAGKNGSGATAVASGSNLSMVAGTAVTFSLAGLTASTEYTIYFVAGDNVTPTENWSASPASKEFKTKQSDTTPPEVTAFSTPTGITDTAANFSVTINEAGRGYYVVQLKSIAQVPTVDQIKLGQNSAGASVPSGSLDMLANTAKAFSISGLTASTEYVIYFIARDNATPDNNWQVSPASQLLTTVAAVDYCAQDGSQTSVPIGTCCFSAVSEHVTRKRAQLYFGTYYTMGSFSYSLGAAPAATKYLKKTATSPNTWANNGACP